MSWEVRNPRRMEEQQHFFFLLLFILFLVLYTDFTQNILNIFLSQAPILSKTQLSF